MIFCNKISFRNDTCIYIYHFMHVVSWYTLTHVGQIQKRTQMDKRHCIMNKFYEAKCYEAYYICKHFYNLFYKFEIMTKKNCAPFYGS